MTEKEKRTIPLYARVSPRFKAWLKAESVRRNLTVREVLDSLALTYVIDRSHKTQVPGKEVTPWPMD